MSEYFHAKVKLLRQMSNGLVKQVTEQYLVDAMSVTETEARCLSEIGDGVREVSAVSIAKSPIKEVVMYGDTDMFFKVKVTYNLTDEETEKEKKITTYLLVNANDAKEAYERTEEHLKEMLVPFQIPKIEESPIIEVYEYQRSESVGPQNSAGAYYDLELTEEQKELLRQRASYSENAPDSDLFTGTPILQLSQIEINRMRKLLKHFHEFGLSEKSDALIESKIGLENPHYRRGMASNSDDEHEEECAFEEDFVDTDESVAREMLESSAFFPEEMKSGRIIANHNEPLPIEKPAFTTFGDAPWTDREKKEIQAAYFAATGIDPTDGQAVAFSATLTDFMESIIPSITIAQIERIRSQVASLPRAEAVSWLIAAHGLNESQAQIAADHAENDKE